MATIKKIVNDILNICYPKYLEQEKKLEQKNDSIQSNFDLEINLESYLHEQDQIISYLETLSHEDILNLVSLMYQGRDRLHDNPECEYDDDVDYDEPLIKSEKYVGHFSYTDCIQIISDKSMHSLYKYLSATYSLIQK